MVAKAKLILARSPDDGWPIRPANNPEERRFGLTATGPRRILKRVGAETGRMFTGQTPMASGTNGCWRPDGAQFLKG